jgi:two-component system nitrate/nitrite response regulator NarL
MAEFTRREREVMALVVEGLPNKLIARRLFLTVGTVKRHMHNIRRKTSTHSRLQVALMAVSQ